MTEYQYNEIAAFLGNAMREQVLNTIQKTCNVDRKEAERLHQVALYGGKW